MFERQEMNRKHQADPRTYVVQPAGKSTKYEVIGWKQVQALVKSLAKTSDVKIKTLGIHKCTSSCGA